MKKEQIVGWLLFALAIVGGAIYYEGSSLYFKLIIGMALGYVLSRSFMGFAGSINRAYRNGSTKLVRALMLMVVVAMVLTAAVFLSTGLEHYKKLNIYPINLALMLGALLFGYGMSTASCCASGVLTDLSYSFPRAIIVFIFFTIGTFLGLPFQRSTAFVKQGWFGTSTVGDKVYQGVFLPDLFGGHGLMGYLGAIVLSLVFVGIIVVISYRYEHKRKTNNSYSPVISETNSIEAVDTSKNFKLFSKDTYNRLFVNQWSLTVGAVMLAILSVIILLVSKKGWGITTSFGVFFGNVLMVFGVSPESLEAFTHYPASKFATPFFKYGGSLQNFGIFIGALIYMLQSNRFVSSLKATSKINMKEVAYYVVAGLSMGFGTRLANGCNVGALLTPISQFSLSGWIFLIFMVLGGIVGNALSKKTNHCPL